MNGPEPKETLSTSRYLMRPTRPFTASYLFQSPWFLPVVLILTVITRSIAAETRGLTYDDAFSIFLSGRTLAEIVRGTAADTMPPLYYFLLHFWMGLGENVWLLRALNILVSTGTVALLHKWTGELAGPETAGWAALIASISPLHVYHAQDIRMYAVLAFTQLGYAFFATRLIKKGARQVRPAGWVGLILFGALSMYSHNLAGAVLVVPNLILLVQKRWRELFQILAAQLVIIILALPWLLLVPGQVEKIQAAFWTPRPGIVEVLQSVILFHSHLPLPGIWIGISALFSVQAVVLILFTLFRAERDGRPIPGVLVMGAFALVPPILLFIISYGMRPVFITRAFLFSTLPYYALAGMALSQIRLGAVRGYLAASFAGLALIGLVSLYPYSAFPRSPFREMTASLQEVVGSSSLVLHDNKLSYFPSRFYAPNIPQAFLPDEPGSFNDTFAPVSQKAMNIFSVVDYRTAVNEKSKVYYVVFDQALEEYANQGMAAPPALDWLREQYTPGSISSFGDLKVFSFSQDPSE